MKPKERQTRILELVAVEGEARVERLAEAFGVSAETIRRDLVHLAGTGALQKVHGGARRPPLLAEGSYADRMAERAQAKAAIGAKLAAEIADGETLFIDTGTTTLACAAALSAREGLTVVTNSVRVAEVVGRSASAAVYLLGGRWAGGNAETVGPMAIEQIGRFQADRAVLTVAALDAEAGATDADFDEAQVARAMIANAREIVVVADTGKLGHRAGFGVCRLSDIDLLVTDADPGDGFAAALAAADVSLR